MDDLSKLIRRKGDHIIMPGFATAHSHAFQRALRGRTQRRGTAAGSFWSWRGLMYNLVEKLDPDDILNISRFAFVELALSGVTAVGEFHYVHHQPGGTPYDDRIVLAEAVIRAAREAGLRITLIRTAYFRAGYQQELAPAQKRFCDASVDEVLRDVETILARFKDDPFVNVAVAAHSIRAVPVDKVKALAEYAQRKDMPFHMHVSEQRREIEECVEEYGRRPVELLAKSGVLGKHFVAVHSTHLNDSEISALGEAQAMVCLCRTTERDLGDGLPRTADLLKAGARICVGVDSHASSDAFEEIRAVEMDERSRTETRAVAEGPELLQMATLNGYEAIGIGEFGKSDAVRLDATEASLAGSDHELLDDAIIFGGTPRAVGEVEVGGESLVKGGHHVKYDEARCAYEQTLRKWSL